MAETLKTIASSTAKLRELLAESKKDLHRIKLLLDALDEGLKSLWPGFDGSNLDNSLPSNGAAVEAISSISRHEELGNDPGGDVSESSYIAPQLASNASLWKETVALVASSRIVGIAAQADHAFIATGGSNENVGQRTWFADGKLYSRWIGRGAVWLLSLRREPIESSSNRNMEAVVAPLIGKGMGIGYRDELVAEVTKLMVLDDTSLLPMYSSLVAVLKTWEQRSFLSSLLNYVAKLLNQTNPDTTLAQNRTTFKSDMSSSNDNTNAISAVSYFLQVLINDIPDFQSQLVEFLVGSPQNIPLARATIAALPDSARVEVLEKTWSKFSDILHTRNTPVLSQEANARVLLITAGFVFRAGSNKVLNMARSAMHGNSISERLRNSSERISWLGMCVGMAISSLVDEEGKRMDFGVDEVQSAEAQAFRSLIHVKDKVGDVHELQSLFGTGGEKTKPGLQNLTIRSSAINESKASKTPKQSSKIIEIVEESEDDNEEDDDLQPYAKPDSDEPDSDEDATLVNRNKPKAPVYIRDLISALSDTENEPRHLLGLRTAASLIRRKATFGKELYDRIQELGQCLVSLQDHFETEDFHELRQEGLVALIVADPATVGPWIVKTLFEGDLSISQRVAIIVAIGVGGRELAGFKDTNDSQSTKDQQHQQEWPSKMLPGNLHDLYKNTSGINNLLAPNRGVQKALKEQERGLQMQSQKIDGLSRQMESTMLNPVSTREWSKPRPRTRMLKNDLTTTVASSFFFPLTRYWQAYSQSSSTQVKNPLGEPVLTALTIKTLTLLLLAAGPSAPSLPQTTKEMFALLLSLRSKASRHQPVLEGILFALVAILDLHGVGVEGGPSAGSSTAVGARWLAEECGKEIVELREWAGGVWEGLEHAGNMKLKLGETEKNEKPRGNEETERCRVLVAKVLVGMNETVQKYQRLLVGELSRV